MSIHVKNKWIVAKKIIATLLFVLINVIGEVGLANEKIDKFDINNPWQNSRNTPVPPVAVEPIAKVEASKESALTIKIQQIRITGQDVTNESGIVGLVQGNMGREVSLAEIQNITREITQYYRSRGYLVARAYLPAQEIKDGVIDIGVLLGHYGKIIIHNESGVRLETVQNMIHDLQSGDIIEKKKLDRHILLLNDIPGIKIKAVLSPGASVGTSDLTITVEDEKLITGTVGINNYGSPYIGKNQRSVGVTVHHPTGQGDVLAVNAMMPGQGLHNTDVSYQLPIGGSGLRFAAGFSKTHYDLGEEFTSLQADGQAATGNVSISYPFVRSYRSNLYGQISYQRKEMQDRIGVVGSVTEKSARVMVLGLSGDRFDDSGYGGVTTYSLSYSMGSLGIKSADAKALDELNAQTNGNYGKLAIKIVRQQKMKGDYSLYLSLASQFATNNLDSSEKMSLGGAYGVRAYPQGEGMGDEGYLFTAEVRRELIANHIPGNLQLAAFFDTGSIRTNKRAWAAGANRRTLSGLGVGLIWNKERDFYMRIDYAWALGDEKAIAQTANRQRLWFQGIHYF